MNKAVTLPHSHPVAAAVSNRYDRLDECQVSIEKFLELLPRDAKYKIAEMTRTLFIDWPHTDEEKAKLASTLSVFFAAKIQVGDPGNFSGSNLYILTADWTIVIENVVL